MDLLQVIETFFGRCSWCRQLKGVGEEARGLTSDEHNTDIGHYGQTLFSIESIQDLFKCISLQPYSEYPYATIKIHIVVIFATVKIGKQAYIR